MKNLKLILLIVICLLSVLIITVLGLGVAVESLFGSGKMFGITVVDNVTYLINYLGGAGLVGLIILLSLLIIKWRRKY